MAVEYFAFVESSDSIRLPGKPLKDPSVLDRGWAMVLEARGQTGPLPTDLVRLDCIAADYFLSLSWINEPPVADADAESKQKRRTDLLEIDAEQLRVVELLLSDRVPGERNLVAVMSEQHWHRIVLSDDDEGLPALVAPDLTTFEVESVLQYFQYRSPTSSEEYGRLYNVFNVDFIDEMTGGDTFDEGPGGGGGPRRPDGLTDAQRQQRQIRYQQNQAKAIYRTPGR